MRPERFQEIDALLAQVLELPAEDRRAFLDEGCAGRPATRAQVERLLAVDAQGASLLDHSPAAELRNGVRLAPGTRLGPYRVERELGRGGMGVVYLAERDDGQYQRRVAIKLLDRSSGWSDGDRRFRAEREILASLEHPSIARLYDSGETRRGEPFLVMEYVPGEPIDSFCDRSRQTIDDRLRLFWKVLQAVAFAHQSFLVHRDLKPANILVAETGEPSLIDFGIAKLLDERRPRSAGVACTTGRVMTPTYASPEQIRGEIASTATDIYALGVVLYELLCGELPYRLPGTLPHQIEAAVLEQVPRRPSQVRRSIPPEELAMRCQSRATSPRRLARCLRGDLDVIVCKALEKEPQRRYGTVLELAADIERHLAGLPIAARSNCLAYRTGKFLRRHRLAMASTTLAVLTGTGLLASTLTQGRKAMAERDKTERALALLEACSGNQTGRLEEIEALHREALEISSRVEGPRSISAADAYFYLARVLALAGRMAEAEQAHRDGLAIQLERRGPNHTEVAASRSSLGRFLNNQARLVEAEEQLREALRVQSERLPPGSSSLLATQNELALVLSRLAHPAEAVTDSAVRKHIP